MDFIRPAQKLPCSHSIEMRPVDEHELMGLLILPYPYLVSRLNSLEGKQRNNKGSTLACTFQRAEHER